jgi:hypothetical protein
MAACLLAFWTGTAHAQGEYPLTLAASAKATKGETTVTSTLRIHVDRAMDEASRARVTDVLKHEGYQKFFAVFRPLPAIGVVEFDGRTVQLRYERDQRAGTSRRLILVADRPLFFFGANAAKPRAGYELTVVDLVIDALGAGTGTGTIAGAARVKPAPDGSVILDDFAEAPVQLTAVRRVAEK